jgi:hypothetical protein
MRKVLFLLILACDVNPPDSWRQEYCDIEVGTFLGEGAFRAGLLREKPEELFLLTSVRIRLMASIPLWSCLDCR